jgi:hypothetical protein
LNIKTILGSVNKWLKNNCLSLNIEKTHYTHFKTKNSQPIDINMCVDDNRIYNNLCAKFLGLIVDSTLFLEARHRPLNK